jgi:uncharacterized protein YacL
VTWQLASILPVWALAIIGSVVIGLFSLPGQYFTWVPIVFAAAILAAFTIQLAIRRKEGFVTRVMVSTGGALVVLVASTAIFAVAS